jgi:hypothetical protein
VDQQQRRISRTMNALNKPVSRGKLFVAGKLWATMKDADPKAVAQELGFGILIENGDDVTVIYDRHLKP